MGNYIDPTDIDNWPSGCDAACQAETILFVEQLIEKITKTWFYPKAFDIEINGNNKNRINLPLSANILTITAVYICGAELDPSWYDFDASSVYLQLCGSGALAVGSAEYYYRQGESDEGLFPRGHNNVRFIGTAGHSVVPIAIKKAAIWLTEAYNDGEFDTSIVGAFDSEKIGDYSYKKGLTGYAKSGIYTGIPKVDAILRHYIRQRKTIIMAP